MHRKRKQFLNRLLSVLLSIVLVVPVFLGTQTTDYQAKMTFDKSVYNSAYKFYHAMDEKFGNKWALYEHHALRFVSRGQLAKNPSYMRYYTMGWTITLTTTDKKHSMSIEVARNDEFVKGKYMTETEYNGTTYNYLLCTITFENLQAICKSKDPTTAAKIFEEEEIYIVMDAINTTIDGGKTKPNATLKKEEKGELSFTGDVWRFVNDDEYNEFDDMFVSSLDSYRDIKETLTNPIMNLYYYLGPGVTVDPEVGYLTNDYYLGTSKTKKKVVSKRELETLKTQARTGIKKEGYYWETDTAWKNEKGKTFKSNTEYGPGKILPEIGDIDDSDDVVLYANWKKNGWNAEYKPGFETTPTQTMKTDEGIEWNETYTVKKCTFTRTGYTCSTWKLTTDYSGGTLNGKTAKNGSTCPANKDGITAKNLTATNGGTVTFTAVWTPNNYTITCDKNGGTGGTDSFVEEYNTKYKATASATTGISSIAIPDEREGYTFDGYFDAQNPAKQVVDSNGKIVQPNTYFTSNATIIAKWTPIIVDITYDFQGGKDRYSNTSTMKSVLYGTLFPSLDLPVNEGFTFKGFYTLTEGKGTQYYSETGAVVLDSPKCTLKNDITLYAHWLDEVPPTATISASTSSWTNRPVTITCVGEDDASPVKKMILKEIDSSGTVLDVKVWDYTGTKKEVTEYYTHPVDREGTFRYTIECIDANGLSSTKISEPIIYVQYDITNPQIIILTDMSTYVINLLKFLINFDGTDNNME